MIFQNEQLEIQYCANVLSRSSLLYVLHGKWDGAVIRWNVQIFMESIQSKTVLMNMKFYIW